MEIIKTTDLQHVHDEQADAYIQPHSLSELWFHTGTACNLSCPFCLEGSSPGDKRLEPVRLEDVKPYIDESLSLGVEQFSFTGGEPFVVRQIIDILKYASERKPCLVLSNGSEALTKRMQQLRGLRDSVHPVSFRISIDYPDKVLHDAGRGLGAFDESMGCIAELQNEGFQVSLARQMEAGENIAAVENKFKELFLLYGISEDTRILAFPDFHSPGSLPEVPTLTENCMTRYQSAESRKKFMCAFSKMLVKIQGEMRIYACTLVDDDPYFDLGNSLIQSVRARILLKHHRCYSCFKYGSSCSET